MLNLGTNSPINKIYLGNNEILKAYLGDTIVYDKTYVRPTLTELFNPHTWLDAEQESFTNGQTVSTVSDFSGNNYDFNTYQSTVTYNSSGGGNGFPCFDLTETGGISSNNSTRYNFLHQDDPMTMFLVYDSGPTVVNKITILFHSNNISSANIGLASTLDDRASFGAVNSLSYGAARGVGGTGYHSATKTNNYNDDDTIQLITAKALGSTTGNNGYVQIKGKAQLNSTVTSTHSTGNSTNSFTLGRGNFINSIVRSIRKVSELIVYDKALTSVQITSVENYLANKYGL